MHLTRREFLWRAGLSAAGAGVASAALASCGFVRQGSTVGPRELSFTTWGSDSELAGFRRAIADFQTANPGDTVQLNSVPYEQFFQNVDAQLQTDTAPDVFRVDYDNLGTYAGRSQLLDLSGLLPEGTDATFTEALWQAVQYDDRPFGVPHHTDCTAILYSTAAFERAGITAVPTQVDQAWTWDQFADVARALQDSLPPGEFPFAYNWQGQGITRWLNWLFEADGRFLDASLRRPAIDSDAGHAAVDFTKSFFTERWVPPNSSVKSATYASDLFFSETVPMVFGGAFLLPDAVQLAPFEFGATFAPRGVRGGGDLGGNALVATAGTSKGELAARFLAFMTERETMQRFCETASLLPTRRDLVTEGIRFADRPELSPVFVGQATTVRAGDAAQIASPSMAQINTVLGDAMEAAFAGGASTTDTVAAISDGIGRAISR